MDNLEIKSISINKITCEPEPFGELIKPKVIINDIEITTREDWNKVLESLAQLKEENKILKDFYLEHSSCQENLDNAHKIIDFYKNKIDNYENGGK